MKINFEAVIGAIAAVFTAAVIILTINYLEERDTQIRQEPIKEDCVKCCER